MNILNALRSKKNILLPFGLVIFAILIFFSFGFYRLGRSATVDEHYWTSDPIKGRIHQYWRAIRDRNLPLTYINDKPGITVALIAGLALPFETEPEKKVVHEGGYYRVYDPGKNAATAFLFRVPILIFNGLMAFYFFWILTHIFADRWKAAAGAAAILLSPILLGISAIVNPDSLLWVFAAASIFSFIAYLMRGRRTLAVLTALFFGLALLSKYSAIILTYYFWALILFYFWIGNERGKPHELSRTVLDRGLGYLAINLGALMCFAFFLPATWQDPQLLISGTFGFGGMQWAYFAVMGATGIILLEAKLSGGRGLEWFFSKLGGAWKYLLSATYLVLAGLMTLALVNWNLKLGFDPQVFNVSFDDGISEVFADQKILSRSVLEAVSLAFSLTPVALGLLLLGWILAIFRRPKDYFAVWAITLFFPIFYVGVLKMGLLANIRYSIVLYPLAAVLGILGLFAAADSLPRWRKRVIMAGLGLMFISAAWSMWTIKPFYFNYTNDLLPKYRVITGAWGYGGYEAAEYLNKFPEAEKLIVWADINGFCPFFKGVCIKGSRDLKLWREGENQPIDYILSTRRGGVMYEDIWQRLVYSGAIEETDAEFRLDIGDRPANFIRLLKVSSYERMFKK